MSNQPARHRLVVWPLAAGLLVALAVGVQRLAVERRNQQVALITDYAEVQTLAAYAGLTPAQCLARLKAAGATAVSVEEPLLGDLAEGGLLRVDASPDGAWTRLQPQCLLARSALHSLRSHYGPAVAQPDGSPDTLRVAVPWTVLRSVGAGLDPQAFADARAAGVDVAARLRNDVGLGAEGIRRTLGEARGLGARLVIFSGDQVMGYRKLLDHTAEALAGGGLAWGRVEFARQYGEAGLADALFGLAPPQTYVRVHSVTAPEMVKVDPAELIERYRRAARERNIRACFVRLLLLPTDDPLARNEEFLSGIAGSLRRAGLTLGTPEPWPWTAPPLGAQAAIGTLGCAAAAAWLGVLLTGPFTLRRWLTWWAVLALLPLPLLLRSPSLYAKGMALLAGVTWPTLGGRWAWQRLSGRPPRGWLGAVGVLWGAVAWSVAGGLLIAALLASTPFMLHHQGFMGVKLTQVVPIALVAALAGLGLGEAGLDRATVRRRWLAFWSDPLLRWQIAAVFVALVAVGLLLMRSGNEAMEVSPLELRLRTLLEVVFGARPRTKEFMLGHPALLLAALAAVRGARAWVAPLLLVGMVGIVSTLNTFCHIHTPLTQSLLRTFHALWLGTLLGTLAWWVLGRWAPSAFDATATRDA